ncbi:DNA recombination protein RmuC [Pseudomonadales bacterium]|jgi:DNA recombination protein RmuC|nr:DNA recombination protein RmuC [Pseudomonadales bacterium]MDC3364533.1 DNA recombination protein RmuC [Pseudomonadales bacterium]
MALSEIILSLIIGCLIIGQIFWIRRGDAREAAGKAEIDDLQAALSARTSLDQTARNELTQLETSLVAKAELEAELRQRLQAADLAVTTLNQEKMELREQLAQVSTAMAQQTAHHQDKLVLLDQTKEKLSETFKSLASEIFESKQQTFKHQSEEQLTHLLKPLGERLKDFQTRVETAYSEESKERFSLRNELKNLRDLNTRLSLEAVNLTNALKGESKTQGTWGEIILERVLEKSGLVKGREYDVQLSLKSEEGRRYQPDVVVHLPEGKDIIVDSKVSLTAYERYCSAVDVEQQAHLVAHVQSLRNHVKQLGEKDYQNLAGIQSLDFVLMFVPIEAAFSVAMQQDDALFGDAFDRNIVIVTPSTLLATLRTIQNIWRYEHQSSNAQEIAAKAGGLFDKLVSFVTDLELVGTRLASTQNAFDDAHKKLSSGRGNLIKRAEAMRRLGAKTSKSMPKHLVEDRPLSGIGLVESDDDDDDVIIN